MRYQYFVWVVWALAMVAAFGVVPNYKWEVLMVQIGFTFGALIGKHFLRDE